MFGGSAVPEPMLRPEKSLCLKCAFDGPIWKEKRAQNGMFCIACHVKETFKV